MLLQSTYKDDNNVEWEMCVVYTVDAAQPSVGLAEQINIHGITRKPVVCGWEVIEIDDYKDIAMEMIEDEKEKGCY